MGFFSATCRAVVFTALCNMHVGTRAQSALDNATKAYELQDFSEAVAAYKKVLAGNPDNTLALARLAECAMRLNQNDLALATFSRLVDNPQAPPISAYYYGLLLAESGRYDEARSSFGKFSRAQPTLGNRHEQKIQWLLIPDKTHSEYVVRPAGFNTAGIELGGSWLRRKLLFATTDQSFKRTTNATGLSWTGKPQTQIAHATIGVNGESEQAQPHLSDLRNKFSDGPVAVSGDGKRVAIMRNRFEQGVRIFPLLPNAGRIFLADLTPQGEWTSERPFTQSDAAYADIFPFLSENGATMYFSSNRPGGYGGFDIYRSVWADGVWSKPENLGAAINTPGDEICPFIDNGVLFFSSDWYDGFGGQDVFRCAPTGSGFGSPVNMGLGINSAGDDFCFSYKSDLGLGALTSNRPGGKGAEDIYIVLPARQQVIVAVKDKLTGKAIHKALVDLSGCTDKVYTTDKTGRLSAALLPQPCSGSVTVDDYVAQTFSFTGKEKLIELALQPAFVPVSGIVVDAATGKSVEGAVIKATQPAGKAVVSAKTDKSGHFTLTLGIDQSYIVDIEAKGYTSVSKPVRVGQTALQIGKQPLMSPAVVAQSSTVPQPNNPPQKITPASSSVLLDAGAPVKSPEPATASVPATAKPVAQPAADKTDKLAPKTSLAQAPAPKQETTAPSNTTQSLKRTPAEPTVEMTSKSAAAPGFSVQLEAAPNSQWIDLSKYRSIQSLGNLYLLPEEGMSKVRLGVYPTREQAMAVARKVKAAGFDTFVVPELNADVVRLYTVASENFTSKGINIPKSYGNPSEKVTATTPRYRVKVGVFKTLGVINKAALEAIGPVSVEIQKGKHHVYVGDYPSLEAAQAHLPLVSRLGFKDAFVEQRQ